MARPKIDWLPYEDARRWVRRLGLTNYKQWFEYIKTHELPEGIPRNPQMTYGSKYISDSDFLGTQTYLPYYQAKYFVRSLDLKSYTAWLEWHKKNDPADIPRYPDFVYGEEWEGWGEFLGTGTISTHKRAYRPYVEALKYAHGLKLKSVDEWDKLCKDKKIPKDIPASPDMVYDEWQSWPAWLGNKTIERVKVQQETSTNVVYVARERGLPANVLTVAFESGGKSAVVDKQREKLFQLIRVYKAPSADSLKHAQFMISRHGSPWWQGENQYIIQSVHQLLFELDNNFEKA